MRCIRRRIHGDASPCLTSAGAVLQSAPLRGMLPFSRSIACLLAGLLLMTVALAMMNTMVPLWLSGAGVATSTAGYVGALFFCGTLAGTVSAGRLIRLFGFNGCYQAACMLCAFSSAGLLLGLDGCSWGALRFLSGVSSAWIWVVVESALLRAGSVKSRGSLLAAYMMVYYVGTVLGQLALGVLDDEMAVMVPGVCVLCVAGMVPLFVARMPEAEDAEAGVRVALGPLLRRRSAMLGVAGCAISGVVLGTLYTLMPVFLAHKGMSVPDVGFWMALLIGAGVAGQWPLGRLADGYGRGLVLRGLSVMIAAACMGLLGGDWLLAPSFVVLGAAGFSLYPIAMAWGCSDAARDELVVMNQLLLLSFSVGSLAGPAVTSSLMQCFSDDWMPLALALAACLYLPVLQVRRSK